MFIYIIRHGETYGNLTGFGFGETDLTPHGRQQIAFLGKRFIAFVFLSLTYRKGGYIILSLHGLLEKEIL